MGFIENLRRKKQENLEIKQRIKLEREKEKKEQWRLESERLAHRENLASKSREMFRESRIPELIEELREIGGLFRESGEANAYDRDRETYRWRILIDHQIRDYSRVTDKSIEIEAFADGTIKFKGGRGGSSMIEKSAWQGNISLLENALEKAYYNPRVEKYPYKRPWSETAGPGAS